MKVNKFKLQMKPIIGIACISNNKAIGFKNGDLIHQMNFDMKHFQTTTTTTKDPEKKNAVVMGNQTYKSMGKPLNKRINYVITNSCLSKSENENLHYYNNILTCLMEIQANESIESIYIIGGATIYQFCFDLHLYDELILSYVHLPVNNRGDVYFPNINFNKYYVEKKSESIQDVDKKSNENQIYTIYYLKKYDSICEDFIKTMTLTL